MAVAIYLRGLLAKSTGDLPVAIEKFQQSVSLFEGLEQPYDTALSLEALAESTSLNGEDLPDVSPKSLLERATEIYARLGADSDENRARARLNELASE